MQKQFAKVESHHATCTLCYFLIHHVQWKLKVVPRALLKLYGLKFTIPQYIKLVKCDGAYYRLSIG